LAIEMAPTMPAARAALICDLLEHRRRLRDDAIPAVV